MNHVVDEPTLDAKAGDPFRLRSAIVGIAPVRNHAPRSAIRLTPVIIIALLAAFGCAARTATSAVPGDFGLRLEFGACTTDVIDTFTSRYVRDVGTRAGKFETRVVISGRERAALFRSVKTADFFSYPSQFRPPSRPVEPSATYRFFVRASGVSHSVEWVDGGESADLGQTAPEVYT
jgi:hypothetical protein